MIIPSANTDVVLTETDATASVETYEGDTYVLVNLIGCETDKAGIFRVSSALRRLPGVADTSTYHGRRKIHVWVENPADAEQVMGLALTVARAILRVDNPEPSFVSIWPGVTPKHHDALRQQLIAELGGVSTAVLVYPASLDGVDLDHRGNAVTEPSTIIRVIGCTLVDEHLAAKVGNLVVAVCGPQEAPAA
ncbi:MAG TPA: hypothetical protein VLF91_05230 [Candidatus Saccharimonadales bacterium]|nr:hypothetical protein [Candidatus Saccharimonadales bacterium]